VFSSIFPLCYTVFSMRLFLIFLVTAITMGSFVVADTVTAATTAERLVGRILIDVPRVGDAWYVHPKTRERYFLGASVDAYASIVVIAVRVSGQDIAKIPTSIDTFRGSAKLRKRLGGYFLMDMSARGKLWYVSPRTLKRKALDDGVHPVDSLLRFGFQTSQAELRRIPVAAASLLGPVVPSQVTTVKSIRVATSRGTFSTNQLILDRRNINWQIMTDTADAGDCTANCATLSIRDFARRRNAVAAMQGTYFCDDGVGCNAGLNSYVYPVFNSWTRTMINQERVKYTVEPMVLFDSKNTPLYLPAGSLFDTLTEFEARYAFTVQAALTNGPAMVEAGQNVLFDEAMDYSQRNVRATRAMLGWKGFFIYLITVRSATLPDAAEVAMTMGFDYALNLDGGGSTALYNDGRHYAGPGRTVPNALVILQR